MCTILLNLRLTCIFLFGIQLVFAADGPQEPECLAWIKTEGSNEKPAPVDWYVLFKPAGEDSLRGIASKGNTSESQSARVSEENENPLHATLRNFLERLSNDKLECREENNEDFTYIMFNDQLPTSPGFTTDGSAKGVIAYGKTNGFFLSHSVPGFPKVSSKYEWPKSQTKQAHLFVCLTMDKDGAATVDDGGINDAMNTLRTGEIGEESSPKGFITKREGKPPIAFVFKHQSNDTDLATTLSEQLNMALIVFSGTPVMRSNRLGIVCNRKNTVENAGGSVKISGTEWNPYSGGASWAVNKRKDVFCLLSQGRTIDEEMQPGMAVCILDESKSVTRLLAPKKAVITSCK